MTTNISWTDETWNPVVGCTIVSPGCTNCYAMNMARRLEAMGVDHYKGLTRMSGGRAIWTGKVTTAPDHVWDKPFKWREPRMIFVNSMSDLFHKSFSNEDIDRALGVMAVAGQKFQGAGDGYTVSGSWTSSKGHEVPIRWPNQKSGPHVFQILTKRADRMREHMTTRRAQIAAAAYRAAHNRICAGGLADAIENGSNWPLPNVWLGISAEDQATANERIPDLLATPAEVRWISAEPLLDRIDLASIRTMKFRGAEGVNAFTGDLMDFMGEPVGKTNTIDWMVVGGESGPKARPMNPDWVIELEIQCEQSGIPFHLKQWGEWISYDNFGANGWQHTRMKGGKNLGKLVFGGFGQSTLSDREYETRYPWATEHRPGPCMVRVGKKAAGRKLFGKVYDAYPERDAA